MEHTNNRKTAAIIAIGDELLSGRTRDGNMHYLAGWLTDRGISLNEARFVPDVKSDIIFALNELRNRYDYVFTSGGIGPTHDDITVDAIAAALELIQNQHPDIDIGSYPQDKDSTISQYRVMFVVKGTDLDELEQTCEQILQACRDGGYEAIKG